MTTGRFSDVALLASDAKRVVAVRPSEQHPELLRVYSAAADEFTLRDAISVVGFDTRNDGWVLLPSGEAALDLLRRLIAPDSFTIATKAPDNLRAVIAANLRLNGTSRDWCLVTQDRTVPGYVRRIYDKLGDDGYQILGGALTFGPGQSVYRLATISWQLHYLVISHRLRCSAQTDCG